MLGEEVKQKALELGFDLVGIARADDAQLRNAVGRYNEWLDQGFGASMDYLKRHTAQKADPSMLLSECKSVVCVALLYAPEKLPSNDDPTRAQVSIYTRGGDYHEFMTAKLKELADWIAREHGVNARPFVDSEPVFERFWAWRAGLGWIGKNSLLLNRKIGSFLFLGGIFTTADLPADEPGLDHCGRCRKCIDACPTVAITENRFIDSNKCIAFHTIENKSVVPETVAAGTGRWIAGCDICQNVCPWNDPVTPGPKFETTNPAFDGDLRELARWTASEFKAHTQGVAMSRMKYSGFLRNVAIAVANSGLSVEEKRQALNAIEASSTSIQHPPAKTGIEAALKWALLQLDV